MQSKWLMAIAVVLLIGIANPVGAVPSLQIYIPGATYDTGTETWVIEFLVYDLWVVGANHDICDVKAAFAAPEDENGSITVTWLKGTSSWSGYLDDGNTVSREWGISDVLVEGPIGDDLVSDSYFFEDWGTPVMGDGGSVPPHGVFPTSYYEYYIGNFGTGETVQNYIPGNEWGDTALGELKKFHIEVTGYSWVDIVAYDHYVKSNEKIHSVFSPFSHDGGSGGSQQVIPEPATLLLFGMGLVGSGAIVRRRRKR